MTDIIEISIANLTKIKERETQIILVGNQKHKYLIKNAALKTVLYASYLMIHCEK